MLGARIDIIQPQIRNLIVYTCCHCQTKTRRQLIKRADWTETIVNRVVFPIPIIVLAIPPISQKILASVSGEYLNPRSDPIPCSYTRPVVMPASFA